MKNLQTLFLILLAYLASTWLRFGRVALDNKYLVALLVCLLLSSIIIPATGAFREEFAHTFLRKTRRLLAGWSVVVMCLVSLGALLKVTPDYSRIWFGTWVLLASIGLVVAQFADLIWYRRWGRSGANLREVLLIGSGDNGRRVREQLEHDPISGRRLVALFGPGWSGTTGRALDDLPAWLAAHPVDDVWIATDHDDHLLLERSLALLRDAVVDVSVIPDLYQYRLLNQGITQWSGMPVINLSGTPMTGGELRIKAVFDRVLALVLVLVLAPLLLLIALAVKSSGPGPVLFRQQRHGMGGEPIEVLKFRTMGVHEERGGAVTQAVPGDQRVTWIGRLLRRSSLDELPQLINVLTGDMSLVGPRPHAVQHNELYKSQIPRYMLRHKVKPGLTGWAQVNGLRGMTETPEKMALRIEHDLWYIQNWSLWLDLRILMLTPLAMIHRNAL